MSASPQRDPGPGCHWKAGNDTGTGKGQPCGAAASYRDQFGGHWCGIHVGEVVACYPARTFHQICAAWTAHQPKAEEPIMSAKSIEQKNKPERDEYIVVQGGITWKGQQRQAGDRIEFARTGSHTNRDRWLEEKKIRPLTEVERAADRPVLPRGKVAQQAKIAEQQAAAVTQVRMIPLGEIRPDPTQPRKSFEAEAMFELVESIRMHGVEQAILVRPRDPDGNAVRDGGPFGWYEIVYGERRWRAASLAGLTEIPAKVRDLSDIEAAEKQGIENLERADLLPLEVAAQYRKLLDLPGYGMERLMQVTGHAKNTIYGKLKLLELPEDAKAAVAKGTLGQVTAERIARLAPEVQKEVLEEVLESAAEGEPMSDREAQEIIDSAKEEQKTAAKRQAVEAQARKDGYNVLQGEQARNVVAYGDTLSHNCGYVLASDLCERDPLGRRWKDVVSGPEARMNPDVAVTPFAVVARSHRGEFKALPIYARDQVNPLLKAIGIWTAEGSKKAQEAEEKRKAKEKQAKDTEAMHGDFEAVTDFAKRQKSPRGLLLAVVWAATHNYAHRMDFVAARRGWIEKDHAIGAGAGPIRSLASDMNVAELQSLVAEIAIVQMGSLEGFYREGRKEIMALLEMVEENAWAEDEESAGARTEEEPTGELEPALI